uniref:Glucosyltransferase 27 n=1 Tax=Nemophila menziesii TaxID=79376 RepID=A0A387II17_NEMME|nr:glucosyltransferase 27 [Nemophila menziesii]
MDSQSSSKHHIAMFPWFAFGHFTPYLHISNELAKRGHRISFLLPKKAQLQLQHLNLYPDSITFHVITVPQVEGLPHGTETVSDIDNSLQPLLVAAMDLTRDQVKGLLHQLKPDFVFFDFMHWIPELATDLGFESVYYIIISAASVAIALVPGRKVPKDRLLTEDELMEPPLGYPSTKILFRKHEARSLIFLSYEFGKGITFYERNTIGMKQCDAISFRTCRELEGPFCDYIQNQYGKPVLLTGPVLPEPSQSPMEDMWVNWLAKFEPCEVVFCAFGSQLTLDMKQFQELVLGIELTSLPFLVALKPPVGAATIEDALPEGFLERISGKGMVCGTMVPQTQILNHPSVGCFVNHCGFGSMWESLMSHCQIVLIPHLGDQILNTRILSEELQVAVEVDKDENGWFSKESVCEAIKMVMDTDSKVGQFLRGNQEKCKTKLLKPDFVSNYIDEFVQQLDKL